MPTDSTEGMADSRASCAAGADSSPRRLEAVLSDIRGNQESMLQTYSITVDSVTRVRKCRGTGRVLTPQGIERDTSEGGYHFGTGQLFPGPDAERGAPGDPCCRSAAEE